MRKRGFCLRVRTWLACVIGVKSINPVGLGWGVGRGSLQIATHIFKKASPAFAPRNVINTTDGSFVVPNVLLQMKLIPDRCIYVAA